MRLPENSLFAILLRARWWVSALAGLAVFGLVRLVLDAGFGFFAALPFLVIAHVALWREMRAPRGARLEAALEKIRAMPWETFARALEEGFRRDGYAVKRIEGAADFELEKDKGVSLVAAKRWKASRTGAEPLKDLVQAGEERQATACAYACAGGITDNARGFAAEHRVKLIEGPELVKLALP